MTQLCKWNDGIVCDCGDVSSCFFQPEPTETDMLSRLNNARRSDMYDELKLRKAWNRTVGDRIGMRKCSITAQHQLNRQALHNSKIIDELNELIRFS